MHIIYPIHAKERMGQRGIKVEQIEQALQDPNVTLPTRDRRRKRIMKKIGQKTLDVIFEPRGKDRIVLVTAAWLKKRDRKVGKKDEDLI